MESIRVFHDRPVWCISVRLSDSSEVTQHKINFVKNCPQWGLNSQPLELQSNALLTVPREESVGDFWSEPSFVSCTTSHVGLCLFLESIEHDFIKALMIHIHNQIVTLLSWESGRLMIWRFWVQTPLGATFGEIYFVVYNFKSVR